MSDKFRKVMVGVLSLALVLTMVGAVGCSSGGDTGGDTGGDQTEAKMGGTFSFFIAEPAFIDPVNLQESEGTQVGQAVFDSLVAFDPLTTEIVPAAADTWEANDDATVWTFHLNPDATFHNGDPVTAADFKYAWERICNPDNASEIAYHLAPVVGYDEMTAGEADSLEGVKAVDDYTLEVTLQYSFGDFEYVVGHPALAPVPKDAVENGVEYNGETVDFAEMPIGNGPFKMAEPWAHDQYVKVVKNTDYYGTEPYLDGVDFKIFQDVDTAYLEFEAGNLDFVEIPPGRVPDAIDTYGESKDGYSVAPGEQVLTGSELAIYYYALNNKDEVLSNKLVREALSLGLDRQAIIDALFEGIRMPATGMVPKGVNGFQENAWEFSEFDPDLAAKKLEEAGYPGGEGLPELTLYYNTESNHGDVAQIAVDSWKNIGVNVKLEGFEWAQHIDKLQNGDYQIGRFGWVGDNPTADNFLYSLFKSDGSDNVSGYSNAEVDSMFEEARATADSAERQAMYQEIERKIGEDTPVIPVMYYAHQRVASERVRDGVFGLMNLFNFEGCYLEQ